MSDSLTKEKISKIKKDFSHLDQNNKEKIRTNDLGTIMRSLGQSPTEAELRVWIDLLDPDAYGEIDLKVFISAMS